MELKAGKSIIAPSVLAADWSCLKDEILAVEKAGADMHHLDVMDGTFVPPISYGADFVAAVKRCAKQPLDVHLMIVNPEQHLEAFKNAGADIITVHAEVCPHLHRTVQRIRDLGLRPGVALNPATPVAAVKEILRDIDLLLIMTINPGWGGQKYIAGCEEKIREAAALIKSSGSGAVIEVDGGINATTGKLVVSAGATVLVAGSFIYQAKGSYAERVSELRQC